MLPGAAWFLLSAPPMRRRGGWVSGRRQIRRCHRGDGRLIGCAPSRLRFCRPWRGRRRGRVLLALLFFAHGRWTISARRAMHKAARHRKGERRMITMREAHDALDRCRALTWWDAQTGRLSEPRPCRAKANAGGVFCGAHQAERRRHVPIRASQGGWCVWCGVAGRRYERADLRTVPVTLCARCGAALGRELRCHR